MHRHPPQRVLDAFQMEQCLIFCRTNFDCDNLELFLNSLGGSVMGGAGKPGTVQLRAALGAGTSLLGWEAGRCACG